MAFSGPFQPSRKPDGFWIQYTGAHPFKILLTNIKDKSPAREKNRTAGGKFLGRMLRNTGCKKHPLPDNRCLRTGVGFYDFDVFTHTATRKL